MRYRGNKIHPEWMDECGEQTVRKHNAYAAVGWQSQ